MKNNKPVIYTIDIETEVHTGEFYGSGYETNIVRTTHYGRMLSFAVKLLKGKGIVRGWTDYRVKGEESLVRDLWKHLNKADIVIGHNFRKFDNKWIITKFAKYGLLMPSPYEVIDTLSEARKLFALPSYSLENVADHFGIGHKKHIEQRETTDKCLAGDKRAWKKMKAYNYHDVVLTEKVYLKELPYMKSHPKVGLYYGKLSCPRCMKTKMQSRGSRIKADGERKRIFQCQDCGYYPNFSKKELKAMGL